MSSDTKPKVRVALIARAHIESNIGGKLRVVRLEPSKAGTLLLTSKSESITAGDRLTEKDTLSKARGRREKHLA